MALLNVEVHRRYSTDTLREETGRLRSEVERCLDAVHALDDEDTAEEARLGFLGHLSEAAATALARALSFGRAAHDDLVRMAGHLATETASALGRRPRHQCAQARRPPGTRSCRAAPGRRGKPGRPFCRVCRGDRDLEASAATRAEVELSYHVPGASWRPLYDLALEGERLAVTYLAEVTQQTGEDWPAVELVLSTTRRGSHQTLPRAGSLVHRSRPAGPPAAGGRQIDGGREGGSATRRACAYPCWRAGSRSGGGPDACRRSR